MPRPPKLPAPDARLRRLLPAAWVVLLLCLPGALWVAGVRQPLLESRPKEEFPAINRSSLRDEHTFRRIDTALLDRFPGREQALDVHARIGIELFRDSTNPDVAIGDSGWLYYALELMPCREGTRPDADPADAADVLARTLVTAGYDATVVVPRSKLFVRSADAPSIDEDEEACARAYEDAVQERLQAAPGGLSLATELDALEAAGEPTFLKQDTHWNWRGRELFARRVLDRIRPGMADEAGLRTEREYRRRGDLAGMLGRTSSEEDDRLVEPQRTPRRPLTAGEVVLVGDSQMDQALITPLVPGAPTVLDVVLPGQVYCNWSQLMDGGCDAPLRTARTVVIEKVGRETQLLTRVCWRPVSVAGERLRGGRPVAWERVDGGTLNADGTLTLPDTGSVEVRVVTGGHDRARLPRLLRLPVDVVPADADGNPVPVTMVQQPQAGPAAPCATPSQGIQGEALFLPVPANRRASDLVVRLTGAPGARLGLPQEIALDGRRRPRRG